MPSESNQPLTLHAIEAAFRDAFSLDLCAEDDLPYWSTENASRGHCAMAALTLQDLLGGDILLATVHRAGEQTGYHYWNRVNGFELDLTRDQFFDDEVVGEPEIQQRPAGQGGKYHEQYQRFRAQVYETLRIS